VRVVFLYRREHTAPQDPQVLEPASMEAEHLGQSLCILEFEVVSLDDQMYVFGSEVLKA
jgi:hypothetical protein